MQRDQPHLRTGISYGAAATHADAAQDVGYPNARIQLSHGTDW
jgi:hypothetical protein